MAKDRVISTVDPEARHGHKTAARGFDGYKGHIAIDPDSELITATSVTAGNVGDGSVADALVADVLVAPTTPASPDNVPPSPTASSVPTEPAIVASSGAPEETTPPAQAQMPIEIYGDASYGTAEFVEKVECAGAEANVKVQAPAAPAGKFSKDAFDIDLTNNTVRCRAGMLVVIRSPTAGSEGLRLASFGVRCNSCELRSQCTDGKEGRTIHVHPPGGDTSAGKNPTAGSVVESTLSRDPAPRSSARLPT